MTIAHNTASPTATRRRGGVGERRGQDRVGIGVGSVPRRCHRSAHREPPVVGGRPEIVGEPDRDLDRPAPGSRRGKGHRRAGRLAERDRPAAVRRPRRHAAGGPVGDATPPPIVTVNGSPAPTVSGVPGSHGLSDPPSSQVYEPSCPIAGSPPSAASVAEGGSADRGRRTRAARRRWLGRERDGHGRGAGRGRPPSRSTRPSDRGASARPWIRRPTRCARRCRRRRRSSRPPRWPATSARRSSERLIASRSFLPGQMHGVSGPARRVPASHRLNTRTLTVGDVSPLMPSFDGVANTAR